MSSSPNMRTPDAEDSLRKRYFFKLATNLVGIPVTIAVQSIVPRALGPLDYGNFNFLTNFFSQLVAFFDGGTSEGFYAKLSQRQREHSLLRFYGGFVLIVTVLSFMVIGGIFAVGKTAFVWPSQGVTFIVLALIWALLTWYSQIVSKVIDAFGMTTVGEIVKVIQKIVGLGALLLLFWFNWFTLRVFYFYQYGIIIFLCAAWWIVLRRRGVRLITSQRLPSAVVRSYVKEFRVYASPLVMYAIVGLFVGLFDRWLLQRFAGSTEQGFYSLSYQIGAVCFLFTSAMTPLITREFAVAFGEQNEAKMRGLFLRYIPMLYSIAAFFSVFVFFNAARVGTLFGGSSYDDARTAIGIMAFYPVHQTYGQLSASVFYATGQTRLYRNVGIIMMVLSLPVTYFLLAPRASIGFQLGATGLAAKMVAVQFIWVNAQLWFNAKFLKLSFWKLLGHQMYSVALFGVAAYLSEMLTHGATDSVLYALIVNALVYAIAVAAIGWMIPSIFSVTRAELVNGLVRIRVLIIRQLTKKS